MKTTMNRLALMAPAVPLLLTSGPVQASKHGVSDLMETVAGDSSKSSAQKAMASLSDVKSLNNKLEIKG